jgi:hypothetical protein
MWGIWLFRPVVLFGPKKISPHKEGQRAMDRKRDLGIFNMIFWQRVVKNWRGKM